MSIVRKKEYCKECFCEIIDKNYLCDDMCNECLNSIDGELQKKTSKKEEWVEVKSPFKPYPPSEGV